MTLNLDFLVIGTQKSASSWLYYCLDEHHEIQLTRKKMEDEIIGGEQYQKMGGMSWYETLFEEVQTSKKTGHISVEYQVSQESPEEIHKYFPDCKFIMLMRDPPARFRSAYYWYLRKGFIENSDELFEELLNADDTKDFSENKILLDLFDRGKYAEHLEKFFKFFKKEQFLFLSYDQISSAPQQVLETIYQFLEVSNYVPKSIEKRPKKNSYNKSLIQIEKIAGKNKIVAVLVDRVNQILARKKMGSEDAIFSDQILSKLDELYRKPNKDLEALLNTMEIDQRDRDAYWPWLNRKA